MLRVRSGLDGFPVLSLRGGFPEVLRRGIENVRIDRRKYDRERPLPAFLERAGRHSGEEQWIHVDGPRFAGAAIVAGDDPGLIAAVKDVGVLWIGRDVPGLAAAGAVQPVSGGRLGVAQVQSAVARHASRSVVLLRAADVIGQIGGGRDVIKLRRGITLRRPGSAAIGGDRRAAVVAGDHPARIVRSDPQIVMVGVRRVQHVEGLTAVVGTVELHVQRIHGVAVLGVGQNSREIKRPLPDAAVGIHQSPRLAGVVGSKQSAIVGFHHRIDAIGVGARDADVDLANDPFRESGMAGDFGPRIAAVGRFKQTARRAAAR